MAVTDNLVSYWKLDEASGNRLDSHAANPLVPVNAPGNGAGKISNAVNLARASAQALAYSGANFNLSTTDSWSVQLWVMPATNSGYFTLISAGGTGDQKVYLLVMDGSLQLARWDAGATGLQSGVALTIGVWTDVVYTFTSTGVNTGTEQFYTDGVARNSRTGAVPAPLAGTLILGVEGSNTHYLNGRLDEVAFWRRALTPTEVVQLYNGGAGATYPFTAFVWASDSTWAVTAIVIQAAATVWDSDSTWAVTAVVIPEIRRASCR